MIRSLLGRLLWSCIKNQPIGGRYQDKNGEFHNHTLSTHIRNVRQAHFNIGRSFAIADQNFKISEARAEIDLALIEDLGKRVDILEKPPAQPDPAPAAPQKTARKQKVVRRGKK